MGALGATGPPGRTSHRRLSLQSYAICLHVCSSSVHSAPHCLSTHSGLTEAVLRPGTRNTVPPLSEQPLLASNLGEHWLLLPRSPRSLARRTTSLDPRHPIVITKSFITDLVNLPFAPLPLTDPFLVTPSTLPLIPHIPSRWPTRRSSSSGTLSTFSRPRSRMEP